MNKYNLTATRHFYGSKEPVTYYNIVGSAVYAQIAYIIDHFTVDNIFIYQRFNDGKTAYIGCYSVKWRNIVTPDGKKTYNYKF